MLLLLLFFVVVVFVVDFVAVDVLFVFVVALVVRW